MKGIGTSIRNMVKEHTRIQQVVPNIKVLTESCSITCLCESYDLFLIVIKHGSTFVNLVNDATPTGQSSKERSIVISQTHN